jgi:hypothetical protein
MQSLFAEERVRRAAAIRDLKDATETMRPSGITTKPVPRRWPWLAGGIVVIAIAGAALLVRPKPLPTAPSASAAPVATTVTFEVSLDPPVTAQVQIAGKTVTGNPARATLPRNDKPVAISVTAEGYQPARMTLPADRDRTLMVPLAKLAKLPSVPPSASTSRPTQPPPKPKGSDGLVTDYPF